jgi:ankyrin repeat protein
MHASKLNCTATITSSIYSVQNKDGWTALHTCCHSNTTAQAGLEILEEYIRKGGDVDAKTKRGPGSYNRYYTIDTVHY